MKTNERVHGLKTDSEAYKLVSQALDIALSESVHEAEQFLREQVTELELKYWECMAIANCFSASVKQLRVA